MSIKGVCGFKTLLPGWPHSLGLLVCLAIATLSYASNLFIFDKVSVLLWAFIYSIVAANIFPMPEQLSPGIHYASSMLLRFSIAVMGFTVSALAWTQVGWVGVIEVVVVIAFALFFGMWLAPRMGLSARLGTLIASGTAICGASAIAAIAPAIEAKEEEVGLSVTCVTLFGLVAMFLYPFLFQNTFLGAWLKNSDVAFGVWAGTGIHETAQVIGAASQINPSAMQIALLTKSVRIFALAPVMLLMSFIFARNEGRNPLHIKGSVPIFAIVFMAASLLSTLLLSSRFTQATWATVSGVYLKPAVNFLLAIAFAGLGFKVKVKNFAGLGLNCFAAGLIVAVLTGLLALLLVIGLYIPLAPTV